MAFRRSRRNRIVVLGTALCAVLIATGCSTIPGKPVAAGNASPFYEAVVDLMTQSMVHYTGSDTKGSSWDVRATVSGEKLGLVTTAGETSDVLAVNGKTYVKPPKGLDLSDLPRGIARSDIDGKWITGSDELAKTVPGLSTPRDLAVELLHALDRTTDYPRLGDPTVRVGADPAYEVETPAGTLAVSAAAPHHVLRLLPPAKTGTPSSTSPTTDEITPGASTSGDDPLIGPLAFVFMSPADRDQAFNDIVTQTQSLNNSVDFGVQFSFDQSGNLKCSEASCTVSSTVSTTTTAKSGATLSGNVSAVMKASVTVNGTPSSGCMTTQTLPINDSSEMSCIDPTIAPIVAQIRVQNQADADARARAQGRNVTVQYTIDYRAHIDIQAIAIVQAEIDRLVVVVRAEQDGNRSRSSCGQGCSYQQAPYNGDKLSQAAYRARQAGGGAPGTNLLVALVPGWNDPKNGDLVVGSGDSQSDNPTGTSEDDLVNRLAAKGFKPDQITGLYSERQPCFATCGSKLGLHPGVPVSYTIPWIPNDSQALTAGNDLLDRLVAEGGGVQK